jgi:hypothetical protein
LGLTFSCRQSILVAVLFVVQQLVVLLVVEIQVIVGGVVSFFGLARLSRRAVLRARFLPGLALAAAAFLARLSPTAAPTPPSWTPSAGFALVVRGSLRLAFFEFNRLEVGFAQGGGFSLEFFLADITLSRLSRLMFFAFSARLFWGPLAS